MATTKKKNVQDYLNPVDIGQQTPINPTAPIAKSFSPAPPKPLEQPKQDNGIPKIIHDQDTGNITGVIINGKTRLGLNAKEVQFLVDKHYGRTANPTGTINANSAPPMSQEQQWKQEYDTAQAKEAFLNTLKPKEAVNATPEQLMRVGQAPDLMNGPTDELTGNIVQNINKASINSIGDIAAGLPRKLSGAIGRIPYVGQEIKNAVQQNKPAREYMSDYSNEGNYPRIVNDIQSAKSNLKLAITDANQGNGDQAITDYNKAIARLNRSVAQLKLIGDNDQRAYVETIKTQQTDLENYLSENIPKLNNKMRMALLKPDPNYYDPELDAIFASQPETKKQ